MSCWTENHCIPPMRGKNHQKQPQNLNGKIIKVCEGINKD